jgi:hypothetical protein
MNSWVFFSSSGPYFDGQLGFVRSRALWDKMDMSLEFFRSSSPYFDGQLGFVRSRAEGQTMWFCPFVRIRGCAPG